MTAEVSLATLPRSASRHDKAIADQSLRGAELATSAEHRPGIEVRISVIRGDRRKHALNLSRAVLSSR